MSSEQFDFLIVDDQEPIRTSLRQMLRDNQYRKILLATSGLEALKLIKKCRIDFLITDWTMPHMSGIELLKIIRNDPEQFDLPVLMISDESSKQKFAYALEECVDGFLLKPFSEAEFINAINKIKKSKANQTPVQSKIRTINSFKLQRQYNKALSLAQSLLKEAEHPEITYIAAECFFYKKEYEKARLLLQKTSGDKPDNKTIHLLGRILMAEEKYEEALVYLQKASAGNTLNLEHQIELGEAYLSLGLQEDAERSFAAVLQNDPTDLNLTKLGKVHLDHGNIDQATKLLQQTGELVPDAVGVFNDYAISLRKMGRYEESLEQYKKCLKVLPKNATIKYNFGTLYFEMKNYKLARKIMTEIIADHPDYQKAKDMLAHLDRHGL